MKPKYVLTPMVLAAGSLFALPSEYIDFYGDPFVPSAVAEALKTDSAITLDGAANEAVWASAPVYTLGFVTWPVPAGLGWDDPNNGVPTSPEDFSATFQAAWDDTYLYLLIKVTDDALVIDSDGVSYENDDGIELYLDGDNSRDKGTNWNVPGQDYVNDRQLKIKADNTTPPVGGIYDPTEDGTVAIDQDIVVERTFVETDTGYNIEVRMNFSGIFRDFFADGSLVQDVAVDAYFGFDIKASDDDDGGERDITYGWAANSNNNYADPSIFGTMVLTEGGASVGPLTPNEWQETDIGWLYGVSDTWGLSTFMGYVYVGEMPYVYHVTGGWMYFISGDASSRVFYDLDLGYISIADANGGFYYIYGTDTWEQFPQP